MPETKSHSHHQRATTSDTDDIDPLVDQQGCGKVYAKLEECLGENNRDWRLCQKEVQALQQCYVKAKKLYRDILKAAKKFPSIKRHQILADIKTEFHANKVMQDSEEIAKARQVAASSLQQLHDYVGLGGSSADGEVQLRGTTP